ncbi:hypothetical protein AQUCO_04400024v1 [Aquilegia coerulea]|uniref:Queuosine 5'-phosphate N-glycosylase/hydrolase n=1 Tax=Aquilegia coerulea TaxID=218851 RepID=A0A2G5CMN0_AQUCA|nr:hypothetical protein AQUCO_04400024v1 [Aquilegia coerulea]
MNKKGQGYDEFNDIASITIFADYIVPSVLRQLGEKVERRACSIYDVERMRDLITIKPGSQVNLYIFSPSFLFSTSSYTFLEGSMC